MACLIFWTSLILLSTIQPTPPPATARSIGFWSSVLLAPNPRGPLIGYLSLCPSAYDESKGDICGVLMIWGVQMKNATDKKPLPKPFEMPDTFPGLHALSTINATDIRAGVALSNCTADRKRIKDYQGDMMRATLDTVFDHSHIKYYCEAFDNDDCTGEPMGRVEPQPRSWMGKPWMELHYEGNATVNQGKSWEEMGYTKMKATIEAVRCFVTEWNWSDHKD